MNSATPSVMTATLMYFWRGYFLPRSAPMIITGMGLQDLASTCTGKMTYRSERTLVKEDAMLKKASPSSLYSGMVVRGSPVKSRQKRAVRLYISDVTKMYESSCSFRPPLVAYSSTIPKTTPEAISPAKQMNSHTGPAFCSVVVSPLPGCSCPPSLLLLLLLLLPLLLALLLLAPPLLLLLLGGAGASSTPPDSTSLASASAIA